MKAVDLAKLGAFPEEECFVIKCVLATALVTLTVPALSQTSPPRPAQAAVEPLSRSTYMQQLDDAFALADLNHDGFADRSELEVSESKASAARRARALRGREAAFRRLDTNKDGLLTIEEFHSVATAAPLPKPDPTRLLKLLDTNRDGRISLVENRALNLAEFDKTDINRDGILSPEEQRRAPARR